MFTFNNSKKIHELLYISKIILQVANLLEKIKKQINKNLLIVFINLLEANARDITNVLLTPSYVLYKFRKMILFKYSINVFQIMSTLDQAVDRFKILKEKLNKITSYEKVANNSARVKKYEVSGTQYSISKPSENCKGKQHKVSVSQSVKDHKTSQQNIKVIHNRGRSDEMGSSLRQNKQNQIDNINQVNRHKSHKVYSKKPAHKDVKILQEKQNPTQKKNKAKNTHNRNNSDNIGSYNSNSTQLERSMNNSQWNLNTRKMFSLNSSPTIGIDKQLDQKQKTLSEINYLLEKKRQILESMEQKIESSRLVQSKNCGSVFDSLNFTNSNKSRQRLKAPNLFQMQMEARRRGQSKSMKIQWK